jgi:ABC-type lipoprotein release transport system permease subunit
MSLVGFDLSAWITPVSYAGGTIQPRLRVIFEQRNFIDPAYMLVLVALLAGFLPARRAARLQPVAAIRED